LYGCIDRMNKPGKDCMLFFAKYPEKGEVKKRLATHLGEDITVELYRYFVLDSLSTLEKCGVKLLVCFYPPESQKRFAEWLGMNYSYVPQQGSDLGQRMKTCFVNAFDRGFHFVVAIGSDIPDLPCEFIKEALSSLKTHDVVIGPSFDGGYYLIGFREDKFIPEVFDGIDWGTHTVFHDTLTVLQNAICNVHTLPKWSDIDTIADLKHLIDRNQNTEFHNSKTISYLSKIPGLLT
jgi:rSAM/selenodomain-associated transferase 1